MKGKRKPPKKKKPTEAEIQREEVKVKATTIVQAVIPAWRQQQMDNLRGTSQRGPC